MAPNPTVALGYGLEHTGLARSRRYDRALREGERQHRAAVVVGGFADEIDAPRRRRGRDGRRAERLAEQCGRARARGFDKHWSQCYRIAAGSTISPIVFRRHTYA